MSYEFRAFRGQRQFRRPSGRLQPDMKLEELVERWTKARNPSPKTLHSVVTASKEFVALIGDLPIGDICHEEMFDFRDQLSLLPVARSAFDRELGPVALIERYEIGEDDRPRIAPTTVGKKVNAIQSLIGFAYAERWIEEDDVHNIPVRKLPVIARRPFTKDELRKLFRLPLFIRPWNLPERPHKVSDETVRWLMLLGMMTGARLEELCQLTVEDIAFSEGSWRIAITDCDAEGPTTEKHLKSESSRRMVPIHRRLLDVGLVRLIGQRTNAGESRLFPELRRNVFDRLGADASRRCNRVIDRVSPDRRLCFHSLRHFFKTHCRSSKLQDSTNDQLTGHAPPTIGRRYGEGVELPILAKELDKLDFEFIDWEPILRAVRVEGPPRWRTEVDHRRPNEWSTRDTSNLTSESLNLAAVAVDQSADPRSLSLFD
jgi:integrase